MTSTRTSPLVVFNSFGDNALGLELRVYVPSMEHYIGAITSMHDAIYDKFTEAGITIRELIDDPEQAISAYQDVLEIEPEHAASRRALERLYERTERILDQEALASPT